MEKVKQTIDKLVHPNKDATTTGTHSGSGVTGTHDSGLTGSHNTTGTHGTTGLGSSTHGSTNAGPHSSNAANAVDPRVDSDRDGKNNLGAAQHGPGSHNTHGTTGLGSSTHTPGTGLGSSTHGSTNAGPHSSNALNAADPRVDSDRDGSNNFGTGHNTTHGTAGGLGSSSTTGTHTGTSGSTNQSHATGKSVVPETLQRKLPESVERAVPNALHDTSGHSTTGTHGTSGLGSSTHSTGLGSNTHGSTNAGPHSSNAANYADPRVDSDRDGSRNLGAAQHGPGAAYTQHGTHGTAAELGGHSDTARSTTSGPHSTNLANVLDPRVDSDNSKSGHHGTSGLGSSTHGTSGLGSSNTGYGSTNAGPHDSNLLNKTDPRVDSDRDGSHNTTGGNFGTGHTGTTGTHGTTDPHGKPSLMDKLNPKVDANHDGKAGFMK